MRNARFWVFVNGDWVKLTLRPGDRLVWGQSYRHEEGWSSEGMELEHTFDETGQTVLRTNWSDGTDCDGRISGASDLVCDVARLPDHRVWTAEIAYGKWFQGFRPRCPKWEEYGYESRDYAAETMGY